MEKPYRERLNRSFGKTLLDTPVPNRKIKFYPTKKGLKSRAVRVLPDPELKPTKYVPPADKPKPRTQKSRVSPPVPLPRSSPIPKPIDERVQKVIDLITPFYKPEAIRTFQKKLSDRKSLREEIVKEKDWAFKGSAKTFEVTIIERGDPAKQLNYTRTYIAKVLEKQLKIKKGLKAKETIHIIFKKKK